MTDWIATEGGGWINAAHVVRIGAPERRRGSELRRYTLLDANDDVLGVAEHIYPAVWENEAVTVIPASHNTIAYKIDVESAAGIARPESHQVTVDMVPVLGWKITVTDETEAILNQELGLFDTLAILMPGGKLLMPDSGSTYDSVPDVCAALLGVAQDRWDRQHPEPPAKPDTD